MFKRPWYDRVVPKLLHAPLKTVLTCSRESGVELALRRLHGLDTPQIIIWVDENNQFMDIEHLLTEAVVAGLGSSLLRERATKDQVLQALADYQLLVGPVFLAIGWADKVHGLVELLVESLTPASRMLVVADESMESTRIQDFAHMEGDFLDMSFDEAVRESRGAVSDVKLLEIFTQSEAKFAAFRSNLLEDLSTEKHHALAVDARNWGEALTVEGVLDALIRLERWGDAFELACTRACERLPEFIDDVGNFYFNAGSYSYLWSRLQSLPPDVKRDEKIAYWLVAVALATNRPREFSRHVREALVSSEAPEIRATSAVVAPTREMVAETLDALSKVRSPATLRAHGFALAWEGQSAEPISLFREAMRLAERDGAEHLVVACGVDIAEVEIRQGNYKSGAEWAEWALKEYQQRGLNENLRYMSALSTNAFAKLLLGELEAAAQLLDKLDVGTSYVDVPGYEAITSTLGDLALLRGEYAEAHSHYSSIHENAPIEVYCFTALSLVSLYVAQGDWESAAGLAESAYALSRSSTPYEQAIAELVVGIALSEVDSSSAEKHLLEALSAVSSKFHVAQSAAWLALVRFRKGRRKAAVEALRHGSDGLRELGKSGWELICARHPLTESVRKLWTQLEYEHEFVFLGSRKVVSGSQEDEIGLRAAEILTALIVHSNGLSGEQLQTHIHGDAPASRSTLKASVSRLRRTVAIGSGPYRIEATYRADFIRVLELISSGELQQALNLYGGSLLPESESPLVKEWRAHVDEVVRSAVLETRDPDHLIQLGTILDNDLEIWEAAKDCVAPSDYRRPVINSRIRRIRSAWSSEDAQD